MLTLNLKQIAYMTTLLENVVTQHHRKIDKIKMPVQRRRKRKQVIDQNYKPVLTELKALVPKGLAAKKARIEKEAIKELSVVLDELSEKKSTRQL